MGKLKGLVSLVAVFALMACGFLGYVQYQAAGVNLAKPKIEDSIILASDGKQVLGHIASAGNHHSELTADQISPLLRQAFMAAEDRKFYEHGAVSYLDMAKRLITSGGKAGGSSIQQQYVKNEYTDRKRSIGRKVKEIPYAYQLDQKYSKTEILDMYINSNYYGFGAYGVEDACQAIFGHSATQLKDMNDPVQVAKVSFLAAVINAPSYYDVAADGKPNQLIHVDDLVKRQNYVLDGLGQLEGTPKDPSDQTMTARVSPGVVKQARTKLPLQLKRTARSTGTSGDADPDLVNYIKEWLINQQAEIAKQDEGLTGDLADRRGKDLASAMLARGGLKIRTSIVPALQKLVVDGVAAKLPKRGLSAGVIVLDRDGGVVAMYGGDHSVSQQNNALYANREPGSIMKTVVLADAISHGISVQSKFAAPAYIDIDGPKIWNDDRRAATNCELTLADAMAVSNNIVFTEALSGQMASCGNPQTLSPIEANYPVSTASVTDMARKMGGDDSMVPGKTSPSTYSKNVRLAIGDSPTALSPLKLASIDLTLANRGVHTKPHIVESIDAASSTVFENKIETNRVMPQAQADIANQVLTGVFTKGTASGAQSKNHPLAGKTGTTDRDARISVHNALDPKGKVPMYAFSGWTGYLTDDQGSTNGIWGADVAKVAQYFYDGALKGKARVDFPSANVNAGRLVGIGADKASLSPSAPSSAPSPKPSTSSKASIVPSLSPSKSPKVSPSASSNR